MTHRSNLRNLCRIGKIITDVLQCRTNLIESVLLAYTFRSRTQLIVQPGEHHHQRQGKASDTLPVKIRFLLHLIKNSRNNAVQIRNRLLFTDVCSLVDIFQHLLLHQNIIRINGCQDLLRVYK